MELQYLIKQGAELEPYTHRLRELTAGGAMETWLEDFSNQIDACLVFDGDEVVGWAAFLRAEISAEDLAHLADTGHPMSEEYHPWSEVGVFVDPAYREQGVAAKAVDTLLDYEYNTKKVPRDELVMSVEDFKGYMPLAEKYQVKPVEWGTVYGSRLKKGYRMEKLTTGNAILQAKKAFDLSTERVMAHAGLRHEAALSDAELAAFKEACAKTAFVQNVYNGNLEEALSDISDKLDLESGSGRFYKTFRPGIGGYAPESTEIEFEAKDSAVEAKDIRAWNGYDTEELAHQVLGAPTKNPAVDALNAELEALNEDGSFTMEDTLKLLEKHGFTENEGYVGHGYMGPYANSNNFAASDGFEYINVGSPSGDGCLVRFGSGYASMDTELWEFFGGELDSFLLAIDPDSSYEAEDILIGSNASGSGNLNQVAGELTMLVQLAQVLENPDDVPAEDIMGNIAKRDREYREEQGQQTLFPEKGASKTAALVDQYGNAVPEDLVLLPDAMVEDVEKGSALMMPAMDEQDLAQVMDSDWYEINGVLAMSAKDLPEGWEGSDLADAGVSMDAATEVLKVQPVLHRFSEEDGFYHA